MIGGMPSINQSAAALGSLGGKATWSRVSKAERSARMREVARKRWADKKAACNAKRSA